MANTYDIQQNATNEKEEFQVIENEYSMLRKQIETHGEKIQNLSLFGHTVVIGILGLGIYTSPPIYYYLLPMLILLTISYKIKNYKKAISQVSGYMQVYLEPYSKYFKWETRLRKYRIKFTRKKLSRTFETLEISIIGFMCTLLTINSYINLFNSKDKMHCLDIIIGGVTIIISLIIFIFIYKNTDKYWEMKDDINFEIDRWRKLKKEDTTNAN